MPRFKVIVTAYARQGFEQEVVVDAHHEEDAENKAVDIAKAIDDWQPAEVPNFDGDMYIREPIEQVSRKVALTRRSKARK